MLEYQFALIFEKKERFLKQMHMLIWINNVKKNETRKQKIIVFEIGLMVMDISGNNIFNHLLTILTSSDSSGAHYFLI